MQKSVDDPDAAQWAVVDCITGEMLRCVQWADDVTGAYVQYVRPSSGGRMIREERVGAIRFARTINGRICTEEDDNIAV